MDDLESPATRDRVIHLHRGGTSVVIDLESEEVPVIVHWGEELADSTPETLRSLAVAARPQRVSGGLDRTARLSAVATEASGWLGTPTIEGHTVGESASASSPKSSRCASITTRPPSSCRMRKRGSAFGGTSKSASQGFSISA